ncbi:ABC transporter permease [Aggregatibacter actinomycetemcomitans]|uniref:ABC transporter permease n=1 Tax=Aggregatibacter actinomycetemcomitans TaxID=714 RepID=UPI0011DC93E8|nr:ABC transporter permease [Aggregatibacter actinomycetemcomitans]QEH48821.1 ABC transporter permease [Aggregatibacter actinomycetemcomitans]
MFSLKKIISKLGIGLVLFFMILGMSFTSDAFLSTSNIFNILLQVSVICVISVGMTYVILTGGIDLSVGSIVALSAVCLGLFTHWGVTLLGENPTEPILSIVVIVSVLSSIGVGALCGYINGVIIVYGKVTSFITTLGMMGIARGLALTLSNGKTIYNFPEALRFFGNGRLNITDGFGIPIPVIIALIVVLISFYILTQTIFGRQVYALGSNREAVRLSGINVDKLEIKTYVINGALAAIGAVILVGRLNAAQPIAGTGYELDAIAATVIGGTSLMGGVGSVISTSIGALIMGVLQNGLTLLNVTSYLQRLIIGLVIILAVFLDQLRRGEVSTGRLRRIFFRE